MSNEVWAPGLPGTSFGVSVATTATSAETQIRASAPVPIDIMLKASVSAAAAAQVDGFVIAFGAAGMGAPTDADMIIAPVDGWVKVTIPAGVTHYRIKSPAAGGAAGGVRGYICGRPAGV